MDQDLTNDITLAAALTRELKTLFTPLGHNTFICGYYSWLRDLQRFYTQIIGTTVPAVKIPTQSRYKGQD